MEKTKKAKEEILGSSLTYSLNSAIFVFKRVLKYKLII
jgi:hypothetical protein